MLKNIYLIEASSSEGLIYKIGITKREVSERIKDFKTGNVSDFNAIKIYKSEKFVHSIEKRLHKYFHKKRIDMSREWFNLTEDDINEFIPLCEKYYNMFDYIENNNTWYENSNKSKFK